MKFRESRLIANVSSWRFGHGDPVKCNVAHDHRYAVQ